MRGAMCGKMGGRTPAVTCAGMANGLSMWPKGCRRVYIAHSSTPKEYTSTAVVYCFPRVSLVITIVSLLGGGGHT